MKMLHSSKHGCFLQYLAKQSLKDEENFSSLTISQINYLSRKPFSVMRSGVINIWPCRNNCKWIDRRMATIVMQLYMFHVHCVTNARNLENVFNIVEEIWVFPQQLLVALKVNCIYLNYNNSHN